MTASHSRKKIYILAGILILIAAGIAAFKIGVLHFSFFRTVNAEWSAASGSMQTMVPSRQRCRCRMNCPDTILPRPARLRDMNFPPRNGTTGFRQSGERPAGRDLRLFPARLRSSPTPAQKARRKSRRKCLRARTGQTGRNCSPNSFSKASTPTANCLSGNSRKNFSSRFRKMTIRRSRFCLPTSGAAPLSFTR